MLQVKCCKSAVVSSISGKVLNYLNIFNPLKMGVYKGTQNY